MATLGQFARRMLRLANRIEPEVARVKREVALVVDQVVVPATPVKTGRARSNWIAAIGAPVREVRETFGPTAAVSAAIAEAQVVIEGAGREADAIFISNNVSYIGKLNNGSSAQAPANFVQIAVRAGIRALRLAGRILR